MKKKLTGTVRCDVLVVGGGMAGLLTAHKMTSQGLSCILCEAETVGSGISKNTTGKVTAQHGLCYRSLLKNLGIEKAKLYLNANLEAVDIFRDICRNTGSLFENVDTYVYSQYDRIKLDEECEALKLLGYKTAVCDTPSLPFSTVGAVRFKNQGLIDACEFMEKLARGLNIYEHTPIIRISGKKAFGENAIIEADKIIIATHFPIINKYGMYFMKMHQEREYFLSASGCEPVDGAYLGEGGGLSIRMMGSDMYVGGSSHRTGKQGTAWRAPESFIKKYYPNAEIKHRWATQDCITLDGMPYIGRYSHLSDDLYVATGFNKWGLSTSVVAAELLSNIVMGNSCRLETLFSPHRGMMHRRIVTNLKETVTGLVSFKTRRCPHMGCALVWNKNEKTWDCPCHGSRFDNSGEVIDNPATHGFSH